jgi:hypothetical protein
MNIKEELNIFLEKVKRETILTPEQERQIIEAFRAGIDAQLNSQSGFLHLARICNEHKDQRIKQLTEQIKEHNWQDIQVQAAIAAMQGIIANPHSRDYHIQAYNTPIPNFDSPEIVAREAVGYASCLVYELKDSFNPTPPARMEITETGPFTNNE